MRDPVGRSEHIRDLCRVTGVHLYQLAAAANRHPTSLWRTLKRGLTIDQYITLLTTLALLGRSERR